MANAIITYYAHRNHKHLMLMSPVSKWQSGEFDL